MTDFIIQMTKSKAKKKTKTEVTLKALLEAGCHFGHQSRRWEPRMGPYLYTARDGIHIFDLAKTKKCLEGAADFARDIAVKGGIVLFVGTKRQAHAVIKEEAIRIGIPFVSERWLGGTITNWSQIKKSINNLEQMTQKKEKGEYKKYTKKEQLLLDREIRRLEKFFGGLANLENLPEAIFLVDTKKEETALREANQKNIPIIAIVDSNSDPTLVDYVIPANDDAVGSIKLLVGVIAEAIKEGKEIFEKKNKSKPQNK